MMGNDAIAQQSPHPDILSDVDALQARCEMARRVGYAKGALRQIEYLSRMEELTPAMWSIWRLASRALEVLETGKAK